MDRQSRRRALGDITGPNRQTRYGHVGESLVNTPSRRQWYDEPR